MELYIYHVSRALLRGPLKDDLDWNVMMYDECVNAIYSSIRRLDHSDY